VSAEHMRHRTRLSVIPLMSNAEGEVTLYCPADLVTVSRYRRSRLRRIRLFDRFLVEKIPKLSVLDQIYTGFFLVPLHTDKVTGRFP
jgi:hypothetical protein